MNSKIQHLTEEEKAKTFGLLLAEHYKSVYRTVARLIINLSEVEDIVQNACVKMWEKFETLEDIQRFKIWACRIASNTAINHIRDRKAKLGYGLDEQVIQSILIGQNASMEYLELRLEVLKECIELLPEDQRKLVQQVYVSNQEISSLAKDIGQPASTVYHKLQRIRELHLVQQPQQRP